MQDVERIPNAVTRKPTREEKRKTDRIIEELKKRKGREQTVDVEEEKVKVVIFTLKDGQYAFPGADVKEILPYLINGLDSLVPVEIGTIQPLPALLSKVNGLRPIYGVIPRGNEVVLLIDLSRLKSPMSCRVEVTT